MAVKQPRGFSTNLESEQVEALRELSEKTKIPQAVLVREAVAWLLEKYKGVPNA